MNWQPETLKYLRLGLILAGLAALACCLQPVYRLTDEQTTGLPDGLRLTVALGSDRQSGYFFFGPTKEEPKIRWAASSYRYNGDVVGQFGATAAVSGYWAGSRPQVPGVTGVFPPGRHDLKLQVLYQGKEYPVEYHCQVTTAGYRPNLTAWPMLVVAAIVAALYFLAPARTWQSRGLLFLFGLAAAPLPAIVIRNIASFPLGVTMLLVLPVLLALMGTASSRTMLKKGLWIYLMLAGLLFLAFGFLMIDDPLFRFGYHRDECYQIWNKPHSAALLVLLLPGLLLFVIKRGQLKRAMVAVTSDSECVSGNKP